MLTSAMKFFWYLHFVLYMQPISHTRKAPTLLFHRQILVEEKQAVGSGFCFPVVKEGILFI